MLQLQTLVLLLCRQYMIILQQCGPHIAFFATLHREMTDMTTCCCLHFRMHCCGDTASCLLSQTTMSSLPVNHNSLICVETLKYQQSSFIMNDNHMFLHPRCALYSNWKGNLFRVQHNYLLLIGVKCVTLHTSQFLPPHLSFTGCPTLAI